MSGVVRSSPRRRAVVPERRPLIGPSRYALLAESIVEDVRSGRYPVGSLLPTEAELCAQFGVSRHTVREALRKLRDMGLVSQRQGVGTLVKAKYSSARYVQSVESISDLFTYIQDTRLAIAARHDIVATAAQHSLLRSAPGQRWRMLEVLRLEAGDAVPMAVSEIYFPQAYAAVEREMEDLRVPIYTLLERRFGEHIAEVEQSMTVCALPAAKARLLKVRAGTPGFSIVRHYLARNDKLMMVSASLYPAGRFTFSMRLRSTVREAEAAP